MGGTRIQAGSKFGNLVTVELTQTDKGTKWLCRCDCGNEVYVIGNNLRRGNTTKCENCRKQALQDTPPNRKDGRTRGNDELTATYHVWQSMKARIHNPNSKSYCRYGGAGLTLDPRWEDFDNFIADMGQRPSSEASIERLDNSVGYWPSNCIWADRWQQASNKSNNHYLTVNGKVQTLSEWARETGIDQPTIRRRVKKGWPHQEAVTTPLNATRRKHRYITPAGEFGSLTDAAEANSLSVSGINHRLRSSNWPDWRKEQ